MKRRFPWWAQLLLALTLFFSLKALLSRDLAVGIAPTLYADDTTAQVPSPLNPRVVYFWADWCPVCGLQSSAIRALSDEESIVAVAFHSAGEEGAAKLGLNTVQLIDPEGEIGSRFGIKAVPTTFIIDDKNMIRFRLRGYTTEWGLRLRIWLTKLL